jgi:hypothetical protein
MIAAGPSMTELPIACTFSPDGLTARVASIGMFFA